MPVISLTFTPSTNQIISGIPETVVISANLPSTIYYTLDGTLPSLLSAVYTAPVELPTTGNAITLSAIAYFIDGYGSLVPSAILTNIYRTDQSALDRTRWIFFEGVVYSYPGGLNIPFYFDANGEVNFSIDIPEADITFIKSSRDRLGNEIGTDNDVGSIDPDETATLIDNQAPEFSSPNSTEPFIPSAKFILIDSRAGAPEQSVKLINGPYMSLRDSKKYWSGIDFFRTGGHNHISGSLVKVHFNRQKGIMVSYYFDSAESRWIKSIGDLEAASPDQSNVIIKIPLVFKWFNMGRQQMA